MSVASQVSTAPATNVAVLPTGYQSQPYGRSASTAKWLDFPLLRSAERVHYGRVVVDGMSYSIGDCCLVANQECAIGSQTQDQWKIGKIADMYHSNADDKMNIVVVWFFKRNQLSPEVPLRVAESPLLSQETLAQQLFLSSFTESVSPERLQGKCSVTYLSQFLKENSRSNSNKNKSDQDIKPKSLFWCKFMLHETTLVPIKLTCNNHTKNASQIPTHDTEVDHDSVNSVSEDSDLMSPDIRPENELAAAKRVRVSNENHFISSDDEPTPTKQRSCTVPKSAMKA